MSPEMREILDRPCRLCGHAMGKHRTNVYGVNDERAGAMGLICPPMFSDAERKAQVENFVSGIPTDEHPLN